MSDFGKTLQTSATQRTLGPETDSPNARAATWLRRAGAHAVGRELGFLPLGPCTLFTFWSAPQILDQILQRFVL